MKLKNLLLLGLSFVLVAAVAVGGTLAYLTSTDSDVNVMTLGNVKIEQVEYERDANGDLTDFTQAKPALPAVYDTEAWADTGVEVNGKEYKVFSEDMKNVVDKIVTVNNTGKNDAYVRTVVAIEAPNGDPDDLIHINYNGTDVTLSDFFVTKVDGVDYYIIALTYKEALGAGEKSAPSLMQVFLDKKTTNEDCALFGDTWDILVVSQAVQTEGFDDPATALNEAFGEISATNHPWSDGVEIPTVVSDPEQLIEALNDGGAIVLNGDITVTDTLNITEKTNIDLNGHELKISVLEAKEDTTIENGNLVHGKSTYPALSVSAGTLTLNDVDVVCNEPCNVTYNQAGTLSVAEYVGLEIWSGKCVLNDSTITVNCTEKRYGNSVFGVGIHGGEFTMNGGAITVTSVGSHQAKYEYQAAIFAGSDTDKVINLNNVDVDAIAFLEAWGGKTVVNTTDASGIWDDACTARYTGTYDINYNVEF